MDECCIAVRAGNRSGKGFRTWGDPQPIHRIFGPRRISFTAPEIALACGLLWTAVRFVTRALAGHAIQPTQLKERES
jgi:hypothetical protein